MLHCVPCGGGVSGSTAGTLQEQVVNAVANIMRGMLSSNKQDKARQIEMERQESLRRQQEEEQKMLEEEQRRQRQKEEEIERQRQFAGENEQLQDSLKDGRTDSLDLKESRPPESELEFKTVGTNFFGTSKPAEVTLPAGEEGSYPTKNFSAVEALRASAFFFASALDAAKRGGGYERAAYLASQADRVIQKQPTGMKVDFAAIPAVPLPSAPERVEDSQREMADMLLLFQRNVNFLLDIETKLVETQAQVKEAEGRKKGAQARLEEAKRAWAAAKPDEKPRVDALVADAQALLDESNAQLEQATQAEHDWTAKKKQAESELRNMSDRLQQGGKPG